MVDGGLDAGGEFPRHERPSQSANTRTHGTTATSNSEPTSSSIIGS